VALLLPILGFAVDTRRVALQAGKVMATPIPFRAIGLSWDKADAVSIRVRASQDGNEWTSWLEAHVESSDATRDESGLLYFGDQDFRFLQVAPNFAVENLGAFLIHTDASSATSLKRNPAVVTIPPVVSRSDWGCGNCPKRENYSYTTPTHLIVHHTAGNNSASDWAAVVRSIWTLHYEGNGWNDIGYNYLIDPNGVIYEGRGGGDGVLGAHFSGVNGGTVAIALLGTFSTQAPPTAMVESLKTVLAWQSDKWKLDPEGFAVHATSQLSLRRISAHRDANHSVRATGTTECPGNGVYAALEQIRRGLRQRTEEGCPIHTSAAPIRCFGSGANTFNIAATVPSVCSLTTESASDWITVQKNGEGVEVRVAANTASTSRSGRLLLNRRAFDVMQASTASTPPCIADDGIVSAASFRSSPTSKGALMSIFGTDLAAATASAGALPLPTELERVQVKVNGRPAPILYVSPTQINFQVPTETGAGTQRIFDQGTAAVTVTLNNVESNASMIWLSEATPSVFTYGQNEAVALESSSNQLIGSGRPTMAGEMILVFLTSGGRVAAMPASGTATNSAQATPFPVSAKIGDQSATVHYFGLAPGFVGLYQANIRVPSGLSGPVALGISVAGAETNATILHVQ
jgi:uncharacterized protein (TIGR03437 family)